MKFPKPQIISRQEADELIRTAQEHTQTTDGKFALHWVRKDGISYVVNEMTLDTAKLHRRTGK